MLAVLLATNAVAAIIRDKDNESSDLPTRRRDQRPRDRPRPVHHTPDPWHSNLKHQRVGDSITGKFG